ncbi:phosphoadenosine phosphosulfate reductase [Thermacetogenium phaeum DSM 12270]|uniref:Phosphoadenosine phosphosulfate reductase n=1 Tax=Thermacetogenium phaeum (strain ATCC BAA-254 / DSM 26808 / PB) TaxID=1089553 RepID=K4LGC6_THEPS|nr:phosphoadenosine phosphosulfate reductase family protein [Thermacetogenium phaeum]AFV11903.1 phosphoadenosine phosphosulfate reductase [Thermacetogenium phaeum DSM 12270]
MTNNCIQNKGKKERHILALSGGKDSAALAVYMRDKYPDLDIEYVFTDSGCELPETYEYIERIRAVLNIEITVLRSERDFDYWLKYYKGVLPSPQNRWCTRQLKLKPYEDYIGNDWTYSYVALRADENRLGYSNKKGNIQPRFPFVEDSITLEDVLNILQTSGLGLPDYSKWRKRSGCYFCFYQTDAEWRALKKYHPDKFEKACQYEENHSDGRIYTWRGIKGGKPLFLRDIDEDVLEDVLKEKPQYEKNAVKKLSQLIEEIPLTGLNACDVFK